MNFVDPKDIPLEQQYLYRPVMMKGKKMNRKKSDDSLDTIVTGISQISGISALTDVDQALLKKNKGN